MNLDALNKNLGQMATAVREKIKSEMQITAIAGTALMTQRNTETGKDANGAAYEPYTHEYELFKRRQVGTAKKEGKKKRAARRTAEATADKPVGRYTGFVNFTLTGQMWASFGIIEEGFIGASYVVRVGGRDEFTRDKLEGNQLHRPGYTRLAKKEKELLRDQSTERMGQWARSLIKG